jgi:primosomal protein N' (replication factor Y)
VAALLEVIEAGRYQPFLLRGITGSGKTEVYLRAVEAVLQRGGSAILLVPEIALVPALAGSVAARFGDRLAILHSNLGSAERQQEWQRIREGAARVVLGPRSAIFAPVERLGLVVVDEEHDPAYKQEVTPRYHGRDLALVRGRAAAAPVLLVSATPSLESRYNAERGRYQPLELTRRVGGGSLPEGLLVDMRKELASRKAGGDKAVEERKPGEVLFSRLLRQEIETTLGVGAQVILLRNRRGYAPRLLCRACGEDMRCDQCGLPRTFHRREERLVCHYCGSQRPVPEVCPTCQEAALEPIGTGTERLEEDFRELFPGVPVAVLDRDTVRRKGGAAAVLERFGQGETKVLIGTQMVSKGHHFPNVALTGVMSADTYLGFPDFRAVERTYNLLTQLAGRAGRGEVPGRVVIQTFHPEHYAIRAALEHDDAAFAAEEMRFRRAFHYPPYTRMVQILVQEKKRERGEGRLRDLARALARHPLSRGFRILGPAPAPLERLRGKWRFQLLIRGESYKQLHALLRAVLPEPLPSEVTVDVDPQDLL